MSFLYFPAVISFSAYLLALYHVKFGVFRPEPTSRLIWSVISFFGLLLLWQNQSSTVSLLLASALFIGSFLLFISALKHRIKGMSLEDVIAIIGSIVTLLVWLISQDALIALVALLATDALAIMPTVHSIWKKPFFEDVWFWLLLATGSILSFFVLIQRSDFDIASLVYVMYFAVSQLLVAAIIAFRRLKMFQTLLVHQEAPKD